MPYQDIPLANDRISESQADIRDNFQEIQTVLTVNHIDFADPDQGKHKHVTFPEQAADPATAASEIAMYSKDDGAATALYLRKENSGDVINFTTATLAATGTCTLPCGLIMKWGTGAIAAGTQTTAAIPFATAFPTAIYNVTLNPNGVMPGAAQDSVLHVTTLLPASFVVTRNAAYKGTTVNFYFLALGV